VRARQLMIGALMVGDTNVVPPEVGLELTSEDLERRRLADTVRTHETEDLPGPRCRQPVELERVGGVAMRHLRVEVRGQVDDRDRLERAPVREWGSGGGERRLLRRSKR
jgi:hypothetical protein